MKQTPVQNLEEMCKFIQSMGLVILYHYFSHFSQCVLGRLGEWLRERRCKMLPETGRALQVLLFTARAEFLTKPFFSSLASYLWQISWIPLDSFTWFFLVCISAEKDSDNYLNNMPICQKAFSHIIFPL